MHRTQIRETFSSICRCKAQQLSVCFNLDSSHRISSLESIIIPAWEERGFEGLFTDGG